MGAFSWPGQGNDGMRHSLPCLAGCECHWYPPGAHPCADWRWAAHAKPPLGVDLGDPTNAGRAAVYTIGMSTTDDHGNAGGLAPSEGHNRILASRVYRDFAGEFTIGLRIPYQDGDNWFCEIFTEGLNGENYHIGGVDALQAIRLAIRIVDEIIRSRPAAQCMGITGVF